MAHEKYLVNNENKRINKRRTAISAIYQLRHLPKKGHFSLLELSMILVAG
jgi:hypothetical protein